MAENESNVQNGVSSADDTKTRKTVRLRPSGTPLPKVPAEGISDPLSARDTDTSNLEILDDTQTRRTVKIKPLAPPTPGAVKLPLDSENTNTRRTVVLRPQATGTDGENTNTRRTVVLRPAAPAAAPAAPAAPAVEVSDETVAVAKPKPEAPAVPVPINPAPAAEVSDETVAVAKPKPAVTPGVDISAAGEDDDRTVKVKRPVAPPRIGPRPMGAPLPKGGIGARPGMPGLKPAPAAPAPAPAPAAPAADDESSKETVKLPQPARPAPAAAPKVAPAPAAAPKPAPAPAPKPAPAPAAAPKPVEAEKKNDSADDEITIAPSEKAKKEKPEAENANAGKNAEKNSRTSARNQTASVANSASPVYLVLGIITLILLLGVTAFTLTQYLDFEQKIQIYEHVPGLPHAK